MYICEQVLTIMKPAHLTKLFLLFISQIAVETFDQGRERKQKTQKRIKKKIIHFTALMMITLGTLGSPPPVASPICHDFSSRTADTQWEFWLELHMQLL